MKNLDEEQIKTQEFINGLDNIQEKISEESNVIDKQLDNVQDLIRKNEIEYDNIIKKYEEEIESKYAIDDEEKDEIEGDKSPDYYYRMYGVEDIIHHNYKNDIENINKSFQHDMDEMEIIIKEN